MSRGLFMAAVLSLLGACASQPGLTSSEIDKLTVSAMQEFQVPGAVVGIVMDGKVVHAAGYGVRELGQTGSVDTQTLFRIASMTKAMTTAALAMLVDEGKLGWDDKVVDHIPGFQMYDPWLTKEFTVTDLITHRSGLRPYAGDLMLWPRPNNFSREDIIHGLRYFKPVSDFRTQYDYDNLLYVVSGELIPAVTGDEWEEFVDQQIFARLDTDRCFAGSIPGHEMRNLAAPHATVEGELQVIERNRISDRSSVDAAAGGVRCSLDDMLKWMQVQLDRGALADGTQLFSEAQSRAMWTPQTIRPVGQKELERDRLHFKAYGLGWILADVHGYKQVYHTGTFTGSNNYMILIPELDLGVVVMLNASADEARTAIVKAIVTPFLRAPDVDWVQYYRSEREVLARDSPDRDAEAIDYEHGSISAAPSSYTGTYNDPWFGDVSVILIEDELWFASAKSPKLTGRLWPQNGDTFMARWQDRSVERDVFVDFLSDTAGNKVEMKIRCLSKRIQCSFVDQEMDFTRIEEE
jgi:CubicO group peptidase (beta-lactamase class C family)